MKMQSNAMITLGSFKPPVGYSDHTTGIEVPIAAVAMGATVIEKHFTLDKSMEGPDHKASLDPVEFKNMVRSIRNIEKALGDGIKRCSQNEEKNRYVARKSIVAKRQIKKGEKITTDMLDFKRPARGLLPHMIDFIIGKEAIRDIERDELINLHDLR